MTTTRTKRETPEQRQRRLASKARWRAKQPEGYWKRWRKHEVRIPMTPEQWRVRRNVIRRMEIQNLAPYYLRRLNKLTGSNHPLPIAKLRVQIRRSKRVMAILNALSHLR